MKRNVRRPALDLQLSGRRLENLLKSLEKGCDLCEIGSHIWATVEGRDVRLIDFVVENGRRRSVNRWEREMALAEALLKICPRRRRMGCGAGKGIWQ